MNIDDSKRSNSLLVFIACVIASHICRCFGNYGFQWSFFFSFGRFVSIVGPPWARINVSTFRNSGSLEDSSDRDEFGNSTYAICITSIIPSSRGESLMLVIQQCHLFKSTNPVGFIAVFKNPWIFFSKFPALSNNSILIMDGVWHYWQERYVARAQLALILSLSPSKWTKLFGRKPSVLQITLGLQLRQQLLSELLTWPWEPISS